MDNLSEADTRAKLIDPAVYIRGWTEEHIKREEPAVVEPRIEIALAAHELWLEVAQRPVPVVAGEHAIITSMWGRPFGRPLMWTTFIADVMTPWLTRDQVRARGVLAVCLRDKPSCLARAGAALAERGGVRCEVQRSRSLAGRMAPAVTADVFIIAPAGETLAAPKSRFCTAVAAEVKP